MNQIMLGSHFCYFQLAPYGFATENKCACHISKFIWAVSYTQAEGFPRGNSRFSKKSARQTSAVKFAASLTGQDVSE